MLQIIDGLDGHDLQIIDGQLDTTYLYNSALAIYGNRWKAPWQKPPVKS